MLKHAQSLVDLLRVRQSEWMAQIIDISPTISPELAVFPGDQAFELQKSLSFGSGDHLELSSIRSTVHIGSHADAPSHYGPDEVSIAGVELSKYLGKAQLIRVLLKPGEVIRPQHLGESKILAPRVLFATESMPNPNQWTNQFNALSPELIEHLQSQGVFLVGIDTPSIDLAHSKDLGTHKAVLKAGMAILEGLVLENVAEGIYTLIALPLKIKEAEASPVRAVLLPENINLSHL